MNLLHNLIFVNKQNNKKIYLYIFDFLDYKILESLSGMLSMAVTKAIYVSLKYI